MGLSGNYYAVQRETFLAVAIDASKEDSETCAVQCIECTDVDLRHETNDEILG